MSGQIVNFPESKSSEGRVKVELDLSNYVTKAYLKNSTGVDTSNVDKLDIDKLKNTPTNLSNLKSKVDKLDVDKLVPVLADLCRLKNDFVKKDVNDNLIRSKILKGKYWYYWLSY